ncbi:hypothetical protein A2962_02890 [Candidatus Woesebacteria bacterium RIFCSPLOWO2_01_FULL_39_61]|uniref:Uncharacterized protein n=1 Tax=Candidatus Woesebacteria bacterium RIFCSPHIGHO2_02_FULL_39_13 TaxID=1802505 RepID=A0A1F7YYK0_9BACT|nr:MAG: hypothetical protein A2692_00075 [Candidatus Woesebacteria bacterium RIFCSPHIGHO2_01_FULL_39_95]OGM32426.1 MAG: hypothetical protein A3D01_04605 [Candidatus Woesebacteria bacterium RIFCSPHIGHO2_02_FULL_39_13]OGM67385.1 MAG: hypothetical protein A2962_02890 [Candidatus Woesebacteria bacterium RIFCSPLOWO2_01_FULL_39_61]OGM75249.1 MAG: hypothetical protein A3H19_01250 [Candidatus Woesebacteria bacterium RIFCSPLOWO2_12_FULL_39_9]
MYPFFALFFFSSASYVLFFLLTESESPPLFATFIVINAIVYIYFIIYFITRSLLKAKISFREMEFIKKLSLSLEKFKPLKIFLFSSLALVYISLIALTALLLFALFIYPTFSDYVLEKTPSKTFSSDIYNMRTNLNLLKYDIKDLKLKLYFSQNPESYDYEDSNYIYKLRLDMNNIFGSGRNDYYLYHIQIHSKKSGLAHAGWQSGGVELHQTEAKSLKSTVSGITADYKSFPALNDKDIFVITVKDKDVDTFYIIHPKESEYEADYSPVIYLDYVEGMVVSYVDYEFLEDEGKIRLFLTEPLNGSSTVIVSFKTDDKGHVTTTTRLEKVD